MILVILGYGLEAGGTAKLCAGGIVIVRGCAVFGSGVGTSGTVGKTVVVGTVLLCSEVLFWGGGIVCGIVSWQCRLFLNVSICGS